MRSLPNKRALRPMTRRNTTCVTLLLPIPPGASDSEARDVEREAEALVERVRNGEDFSSLAAANSKAEDALSGGDLGWRDASRLPTIFWKAIENNRTQRNFITTVRSSGAVHIVFLEDSRDGVKAKLAGTPIEQTHVRHILMFVSDLTPEDQVLTRLNDIRHRITTGEADFATLARLNSVDNSATRGGDIGWVSPGDTVPEFETVMNRLQPGEVSEPVRTPYGYHLIQVLERRTAEANAERSRINARNQLREREACRSCIQLAARAARPRLRRNPHQRLLIFRRFQAPDNQNACGLPADTQASRKPQAFAFGPRFENVLQHCDHYRRACGHRSGNLRQSGLYRSR